MRKKIIFLFLFLSCSIYSSNFAAVIGSNSAVSLQALARFPAADSDNEMRGFACFQSGFILEDVTTTCSFNALLPVSGAITPNEGTIYLNKDLQLMNTASIVNGGAFFGNSYCLIFPKIKKGQFVVPSSTVLSEQNFTFDQIAVALNSTIQVKGSWLFKGSSRILGNGHTLNLSDGGKIKVRTGSKLEISNVKFVGLKNSNLECLADDASLTFQNCILQLDHDLTFSQGSIMFQEGVVLSGTNQFIYSSGSTSSIDSNGILYIRRGVTLKLAPAAPNNKVLYMSDESSNLYLDGSSIHTTSTGILLSKGTIILDNHVTFSNEGANYAEAMRLATDANLILQGGAVLDIHGFFRAL